MAKTTSVPQKKQWSVLVYMAGDNNLDQAGVVDLQEMKQIGTTADVNVVVQFDRSGADVDTVRYLLRKGTPLARDVVASLGETNCGDPAVLQDFLAWGASTYPAERYLVVLWNHGSGWDDADLYQGAPFSDTPPPRIVRKGVAVARARSAAPAVSLGQARAALRRTRRAVFAPTVAAAVKTRAIAFDDQAKDFLDNVELKKVIVSARRLLGGKIAVLGMDACLMSMAEVAYQVRGGAEHLVSSQETEPGDGWPYARILAALARKPTMDGEALSRVIVSQYLASYAASDNVTQAALALDRLDPVAKALDALGRALSAHLATPGGRDAIVLARQSAQSFSPPYQDYCDLSDLADRLLARIPAGDVAAACHAAKAAAQGCVLAAGSKGANEANAHGLSIYFPGRRLSGLYGRLDLSRRTAWPAFLAAYLADGRKGPAVAA